MNEEINKWNNTFEYSNGKLFWKTTSGTRAIKGTEAGSLHKDGYYRVVLYGKSLLVHRVIFALVNGYLPAVVDHIDRNRANNLVENLREASFSTNAHNSSISISNSSGEKGVRKTRDGKYEARVAKNGITYQVGTFSNLEDASISIRSFRENLHGDFHCHG